MQRCSLVVGAAKPSWYVSSGAAGPGSTVEVPGAFQSVFGSPLRSDPDKLCRTKGLKVTAVRGIARTLSTILTQAVEDELLTAHPAFRLRLAARRCVIAYVSRQLAQPPTKSPEWQNALSALKGAVTLNFAGWNHIRGWLRRLEALRRAA
jgi:hypothetical protein